MEPISEVSLDVFRTRLKELRVQHEPPLTQGELGKQINVSRGSISFYENGERIPDISILKRLAEYFEVSSDYLLGITDTPSKSREISIPLPGNEIPSISKDDVNDLVQESLRSIGVLATLNEFEQEKFVALFKQSNQMLNFALSVGPADNLMGQRIAICRFIEAATDLQTTTAKLMQQAFDKYCALSSDRKPEIRVRIRSTARTLTDNENEDT